MLKGNCKDVGCYGLDVKKVHGEEAAWGHGKGFSGKVYFALEC